VTPTDSNYPRLSRPPLREALIDIRLQAELPATFVDTLRTLTLSGFSSVGEIKVGGFRFEVATGKPSQALVTSEQLRGIRFQSADGSQVLQYRCDGITFSVLKNYTSWEPFRDTVRELWFQFLRISGAVIVNRLAVRYINAIEVPMGADFDDYLTAGPRIPQSLPQLYSAFLQRVVVPLAEVGGHAIITQALEQPTESSVPTVIDIDVVSSCSLAGDAPEIWERFSNLRDIKNRIFFTSVTTKTLEAYQ
jgi:uncharacterized protein (TIGR04255 family)